MCSNGCCGAVCTPAIRLIHTSTRTRCKPVDLASLANYPPPVQHCTCRHSTTLATKFAGQVSAYMRKMHRTVLTVGLPEDCQQTRDHVHFHAAGSLSTARHFSTAKRSQSPSAQKELDFIQSPVKLWEGLVSVLQAARAAACSSNRSAPKVGLGCS